MHIAVCMIRVYLNVMGFLFMMLLSYLNAHFITLEELSSVTNIDLNEIRHYQTERLMPLASYNLDVELKCNSFFGEHSEKGVTEYYAKGYVSWLSIVHSLRNKECVFDEFTRRYLKTISTLKDVTCDSGCSGLSEIITEKWEHFLQGTYGVCTKTGLPEDIASKGIAVSQIEELLGHEELNSSEIKRLEYFVNLLDSVSSPFAPHERLKSSRHRLVNEVRRKYKL